MKKAKIGSRQAWFWLTLGLLLVLCVGIGVRRQERADRQARLNRGLVSAVVNDRLEEVQSLLREGADPNARQLTDAPAPTSWEGVKASFRRLWRRQPPAPQDVPPTALLLGVESNNGQGNTGEGVVKALLDRGANPNLVSITHSSGTTSVESPLYWAVGIGATNMTKMLLEGGADARARVSGGETPLHWAIWQNNPQTLAIARLLLSHGADVNARDALGETPLMVTATTYASNPAVVKVLLDHGADVAERDRAGETALCQLMHGDSSDKIERASLLLAAGADVNDTDKDRNTALSLGTRDKQLFQLLLAHGAKVFTAKDPQGGNLLMSAYAASSNADGSAGDGGVLGMVLARGVSVNARDRQNQTALLAAADDYVNEADAAACLDPDDPNQPQPPALPGMIGYLLAHGADVNARDSWGRTALVIDAEAVDPRAVRLLLAHGADVNDADKYGRTALMWAAAKGQADTAHALLGAGADPTAQDVKGHTALYWARKGTFDGNGWGHPLSGRGRLLRVLQERIVCEAP